MKSTPAVSEIIALMEDSRSLLVAELRTQVSALPKVEERAVYDGFCWEWTPAYYCGDRQLFHIHNFRLGLRATMFVGVRALEPSILDSEEVPPDLRLLVAQTPGPRGTKQVKVAIESQEDIDAFMRMVRVKWEALRPAGSNSRTKP